MNVPPGMSMCLTIPQIRFAIGEVQPPDNPVPLPRFFIQVKQGSDYPFTFLNSYDFKIGVGAIDFSVSEPENNTTALYHLIELAPGPSSSDTDPLRVRIKSVCSQNRFLTVTGNKRSPTSPLSIFPPQFLPLRVQEEYKSNEITITADPNSRSHFSVSTTLNGTEVFFTTGYGSTGQKIVTAEEVSTPPYIFIVRKLENPRSK